MKKFKPFLATDATNNLNELKYPKYASYKLDGIRCIFHPELGMVSRSLKPIPNKQLQEKFYFMIELSKKHNRIFDGELYNHYLTFQEITRAVMTKDFEDPKTIKKLKKEGYCDNYGAPLWYNIQFHCFDCLSLDIEENFYIRNIIIKDNNDLYKDVKQIMVNSRDEVLKLFVEALDDGYEGLILRDPNSPYKFGRSTLKEEYLLKVKLFETFDAQVIDIVQATEVDPNAEKTINELGRSVTSRKKDDRVLIEKACAFKVVYNEHVLKVSLAMTDEEKEEVWRNKEYYIGRMIEYKGMKIGAKDVPRHPVMIRFREDK